MMYVRRARWRGDWDERNLAIELTLFHWLFPLLNLGKVENGRSSHVYSVRWSLCFALHLIADQWEWPLPVCWCMMLEGEKWLWNDPWTFITDCAPFFLTRTSFCFSAALVSSTMSISFMRFVTTERTPWCVFLLLLLPWWYWARLKVVQPLFRRHFSVARPTDANIQHDVECHHQYRLCLKQFHVATSWLQVQQLQSWQHCHFRQKLVSKESIVPTCFRRKRDSMSFKRKTF